MNKAPFVSNHRPTHGIRRGPCCSTTGFRTTIRDWTASGVAVQQSLAGILEDVDDILKSLSTTIVWVGNVMTLNDDCHDESESFFNNNYALFFDNVVLANDAANPIRSNWKVGVMWIVSKSPSPLKCTRYIFKHWDNYESNNSQFFYTNIEKRYTDMKPFN